MANVKAHAIKMRIRSFQIFHFRRLEQHLLSLLNLILTNLAMTVLLSPKENVLLLTVPHARCLGLHQRLSIRLPMIQRPCADVKLRIIPLHLSHQISLSEILVTLQTMSIALMLTVLFANGLGLQTPLLQIHGMMTRTEAVDVNVKTMEMEMITILQLLMVNTLP